MDRRIFLLLLCLSAVTANPCAYRLLNALPYPGSCEFYIICWHFSTYVLKCPYDLLFDIETNNCQPPDIANCSINPYGPTSIPFTPPPFTSIRTRPPVTESSSESQTESAASTEKLSTSAPLSTSSLIPITTLQPVTESSSVPVTESTSSTESLPTLSPFSTSSVQIITLPPITESPSQPITESATPIEILPSTVSFSSPSPIPIRRLPPETESSPEIVTVLPFSSPSPVPIRTLSPTTETSSESITESVASTEIFPTLPPVSSSSSTFVTESSETATELTAPTEIVPTLSALSTSSRIPISTLPPVTESSLAPVTKSTASPETLPTMYPFSSTSPIPIRTIPPVTESSSQIVTVLPISSLSPVTITVLPLVTESSPEPVTESTASIEILPTTVVSSPSPISIKTISPTKEPLPEFVTVLPSSITYPVPITTLPPATAASLEPGTESAAPTTIQSHIFLPPISTTQGTTVKSIETASTVTSEELKHTTSSSVEVVSCIPNKGDDSVSETPSCEIIVTLNPPTDKVTLEASSDTSATVSTNMESTPFTREPLSPSTEIISTSNTLITAIPITTQAVITAGTSETILSSSTNAYPITAPPITEETVSTVETYKPSKLTTESPTLELLSTTVAVSVAPNITEPVPIPPPALPTIVELNPSSTPNPMSTFNPRTLIPVSAPTSPATAPVYPYFTSSTTTAAPITPSTSKPGTLPPCLVNTTLVIPDPLDCKYFFYCDNGIWFHYSCHYGQEFSPKKLICMRPWHAQCRARFYI